MSKRFRVALTFAGERREFVSQVAEILASKFGEGGVLYDRFHEAEFSRADLAFYLPDLYDSESDLIVAVFCPDYDHKDWCHLEWSTVFGLLKRRRVDEVMLTRFEHAAGRGLRGLEGFIDLDTKTPDQAASLILQRLAINEGLPKDYYLQGVSPEAKERKRESHVRLANSGPTRESITILHISDMQFGKNHQFNQFSEIADGSQNSLLDRLTHDLAYLRDERGLKADVVAVTGDLAEWGMPDEFDQAKKFLVGIEDFTGLPRDKIVIIPGNHDVNRKLFLSEVHAAEARGKVPQWPVVGKWEFYAGFLRDFYGDDRLFRPEQPYGLVAFDDLKLAVACFNSTMADGEYEAAKNKKEI
jgi:Calcineurin-like phosphoesterase